jgi:hypothetical protein
MRKKYFVLRQLEQPRQDKNLLYRHDDLNEPIKEGPLSFVLFESPFDSVLTASRGSLVSLAVRCPSVVGECPYPLVQTYWPGTGVSPFRPPSLIFEEKEPWKEPQLNHRCT